MKSIILKHSIIILLAFCSIKAKANFNFNQNCKDAYTNIINLKFDKGKSLILKEKKDNPNNKIPYYLEDYIDFLTLFIGESKVTFERINDNEKNILEEIKKRRQYISILFIYSGRNTFTLGFC